MDQQPRPKPLALMELLSGIAEDVRTLVRLEGQLLRDEVKVEISKAMRAASGFGLGAVCSAVGLLFFLLMLVHALHEWAKLPLWASYGLVGLSLIVTGLWLIARARWLAEQVGAIPHHTIFAMKENVKWIKEQTLLRKT